VAHESKIEWTEATWNPWHGCHKVSAGCKNCYMFRDKAKYGQDPNVVVRSKTRFYDPLKWKEPRTIFTCSWSDFFIEEADPWRDEAFAIMALTPQHTYQVLTKRPDRMLEYLTDRKVQDRWGEAACEITKSPCACLGIDELEGDPLPNVWLGVSVEDQKTANERIPLLLETPAAKRFISAEPLMGSVDLQRACTLACRNKGQCTDYGTSGLRVIQDSEEGGIWVECICSRLKGLHWVIAGGESGPDARPMHPGKARSLRDQCTAASVPFFFKQWGEWLPARDPRGPADRHEFPDGFSSQKVGKKKAGRELDGRTWDEMPAIN
jgi:protein gp37